MVRAGNIYYAVTKWQTVFWIHIIYAKIYITRYLTILFTITNLITNSWIYDENDFVSMKEIDCPLQV